MQIELASGDGASVLADPGRLAQILVRLLASAVDASSSGGAIRIGVGRAVPMIEIAIRIDECEIPIERVIGPFCSGAQLEELRHGLGPRILRCLVELHDGTLDAIPAGAGTTVTLRLPRAGSC